MWKSGDRKKKNSGLRGISVFLGHKCLGQKKFVASNQYYGKPWAKGHKKLEERGDSNEVISV